MRIHGGRIRHARTAGIWWEVTGDKLVTLELEESDENSRGRTSHEVDCKLQ
jgi:hypothetical protein